MEFVSEWVVLDEPSLWVCVFSMAFAPLFWNVVARLQFKTKFLSTLCGGAHNGCYVLGTAIFLLSLQRDWSFTAALQTQPTVDAVAQSMIAQGVAIAMYVIGTTFVLTSFYQLGFTGTYLGDYFGILMSERVTSFPFSVLDNPMYVGATINFLATSIWYGSPAGLLLCAWIYIVYMAAIAFEQPWTDFIYSQREKSS
eukprot:TRINITY_DN26756_c0_g1_i1.p1 TRINITY_DN26756_c0_g1~~TRINITY_DN26756_c0_g1_i1.p1  ORF type:complete len:197 (-),score=16.23 TRINITY_DN26756_c0_g1_i1:280-870(-)